MKGTHIQDSITHRAKAVDWHQEDTKNIAPYRLLIQAQWCGWIELPRCKFPVTLPLVLRGGTALSYLQVDLQATTSQLVPPMLSSPFPWQPELRLRHHATQLGLDSLRRRAGGGQREETRRRDGGEKVREMRQERDGPGVRESTVRGRRQGEIRDKPDRKTAHFID